MQGKLFPPEESGPEKLLAYQIVMGIIVTLFTVIDRGPIDLKGGRALHDHVSSRRRGKEGGRSQHDERFGEHSEFVCVLFLSFLCV